MRVDRQRLRRAPNYTDRHDPDHRPMVNGGPAIKVNSNQRYATTSTAAAALAAACDAADVAHQVFVSRNTTPCGSTIEPITATRLGIDTVDVGAPQLSMHSARDCWASTTRQRWPQRSARFCRFRAVDVELTAVSSGCLQPAERWNVPFVAD